MLDGSVLSDGEHGMMRNMFNMGCMMMKPQLAGAGPWALRAHKQQTAITENLSARTAYGTSSG
eukprot:1161006-Pelagomonas_calceolata.AAC.1